MRWGELCTRGQHMGWGRSLFMDIREVGKKCSVACHQEQVFLFLAAPFLQKPKIVFLCFSSYFINSSSVTFAISAFCSPCKCQRVIISAFMFKSISKAHQYFFPKQDTQYDCLSRCLLLKPQSKPSSLTWIILLTDLSTFTPQFILYIINDIFFKHK